MQTTIQVDVRTTEPKHRFEQIMSAYDGLRAGESMHLIVDHDPKCMYYTLRATRGEESFEFEYLENGPETWQVIVTHTASEQRHTTPAHDAGT